jgi:hypothetical protein
MRRSSTFARRTLLGVAALLAPLVAGARSAGATKLDLEELATSPVELTAPLPATVLLGGATAELAWRPLADFGELAGATEWEAFLSVDGGRTFTVRLTPHLDLGLRRFTFRVPDLPSAAVRLLLRFGDERAERAVRLPANLRIVRAPAAPPVATPFAAEPGLAPGEPALPGAPGVLFWVEGRRDGSGLRERRATPAGLRPAAEPRLAAGGPEALANQDGDGAHHGERAALATHPAATGLRPFARLARAVPLAASDILLLIQRQNE